MSTSSKREAAATGSFCWHELGTSDVAAARKFYSSLFGWTAEDAGEPGAFAYTMLQNDGTNIGGAYELSDEQKSQGVPPNWLPYVKVDDVNVSVDKAASLGGTTIVAPMDVSTHGRMAVIQDPAGAVFAMWEPKDHPGAAASMDVGAPCWTELATRDSEKAGAFYRDLFGWRLDVRTDVGMPYTQFFNGETAVGGMFQLTPDMGEMPPFWATYFMVEDVDESARKAGELGAKACVPPSDIPKVGRFAALADPQGAMFSLFKPNM